MSGVDCVSHCFNRLMLIIIISNSINKTIEIVEEIAKDGNGQMTNQPLATNYGNQ